VEDLSNLLLAAITVDAHLQHAGLGTNRNRKKIVTGIEKRLAAGDMHGESVM
jgi:hypothetical protein